MTVFVNKQMLVTRLSLCALGPTLMFHYTIYY